MDTISNHVVQMRFWSFQNYPHSNLDLQLPQVPGPWTFSQSVSDSQSNCQPCRDVLIDKQPVQYFPSSFPGGYVKRLARSWSETLNEISEKPYRFVLRQIDSGKHQGSYVSRHLESLGHQPSPKEERTIKWTATIMYAAGSDTVTA